MESLTLWLSCGYIHGMYHAHTTSICSVLLNQYVCTLWGLPTGAACTWCSSPALSSLLPQILAAPKGLVQCPES